MELGTDSRSAYQDLVERRQGTQVDQKARYFGLQKLQAVQDLDVLGEKDLFPFCTLLKVLRQGIGSSDSFALTIVDLEVVTRELLGLADLS